MGLYTFHGNHSSYIHYICILGILLNSIGGDFCGIEDLMHPRPNDMYMTKSEE